MSWVKRVEAVLGALNGSSIGEIELVEGDVEIILRRRPGTIVAIKTHELHKHLSTSDQPATAVKAVKAALTGVYYASPSPNAASFVNIGDIIKVGQTIALIEAMKVFSEIPSEVAGRVVAIKVQNGAVVKKGDVLLEVEPT